MKKTALILGILCCLLSATAQVGRHKPKLYGENAYQKRGWFFAPGITLMPGVSGDRFETLRGEGEFANDTIYSGRFDPSSRIGFYAEGGRHKFIENLYLIHHIDYGIHYKMLRGKEEYAGLVNTGTLVETKNMAKFSEHFAGAFFNASNIIQFADNMWIHNSLGANFDYRFLNNRSSSGTYGNIPWSFPDPMVLQLHYKLGIGWKVDPGLYIMPTIETPILNILPGFNGKSTLHYFSSDYRPIIISIRVLFLDKTADRKCVGKDTSGSKHDLWGKDMNRYNK
ncbi:MAG: hypothetical protein ACOYLH_11715 [Flavobacteriales bacterium]